MYPNVRFSPPESTRSVTTQTEIAGSTPSKYISHLNKTLQLRVLNKNSELKRRAAKIHKLQGKTVKLQKIIKSQRTKIKTKGECIDLKHKLKKSQKEVKETLEENEWLREMVQDTLQTKSDGGNFSVDVKKCVCKLINHNVPTGQVSAVMEAVLKLAGKTATTLPSKSTVNEWNLMRLSISQQ